MAQFKKSVLANDPGALRQFIAEHPEIKPRIDEPAFGFDSPALVAIAGHDNLPLIEALLDAGADINARSQWWAGGFGVLDSVSPAIADRLIERGAALDIHAAARLGKLDRLRQFIATDPNLVHARGGDGKTPLHFSSSIEIAACLLDHGAQIDARDIDHESTAAQHLIGDHPDVARYLVGRGAKTDIVLAAALGDAALVAKHLDSDPESIRTRVDERYFPKQNPNSGGCIYNWSLSKGRSPHQAAAKFRHPEVVKLLMDRSPNDIRLMEACWLGDDTLLHALQATDPGLAQRLSEADWHEICEAAGDNNVNVIRRMLAAGWPVDKGSRETPLHWAAWHGNAAMVEAILRHNPPLEKANAASFHGTPLGWAIHGSENSWHSKTGDYGSVVRLLLAAGANRPERIEGIPEVRAALAC